MDARRSLSALSLSLAICGPAAADVGAPAPGAMAPIPNPPARAPTAGRAAILLANQSARAASRADDFRGSQQVFEWAPGRVFEIWTAPLRVTTLTLQPGERVLTLAAGDTLRWQIAEAASGEGEGRQVHILIKPLDRGLETNLVLTTSDRLYLIALRSAGPAAFNTAVAWSGGARAPSAVPTPPPAAAPPAPPMDADYRIEAGRRPPPWTPDAVMTDGARTIIVFSQGLANQEAPVLFAVSAGGARRIVNYRQAGDVFVVDGVLDRAELRLGDQPRRVVRITRAGARP